MNSISVFNFCCFLDAIRFAYKYQKSQDGKYIYYVLYFVQKANKTWDRFREGNS